MVRLRIRIRAVAVARACVRLLYVYLKVANIQ